MEKQTKISTILITLFLVLSVSVFSMSVVARDTLHTSSTSSTAITIHSDMIRIDDFSAIYSWYWFYPITGNNHLWLEEPLMCYGAESPVWLSEGNVIQEYNTSTGSPDTWYDAVIKLNLDSDLQDDINVTRSIMVPSGQKYFFVRYTIENINGSDLDNFSIFQGVDYDVDDSYDNDEGGYDADDDFVWAHDTGSDGTYVGFTGERTSAHHSVDNYSVMWRELETGSLTDANNYSGNVGVGLEWDLGTLHDGQQIELIVKFAFANNYSELGNMLIPPSVESSNLSGDTQDIFQPGESVFAEGSGYIPNTRYRGCPTITLYPQIASYPHITKTVKL